MRRKNLFILFVLCFMLPKIVFCSELESRTLTKIPGTPSSVGLSAISADNQWLVISVTTPESGQLLMVIDLKNKSSGNVVYSKSLEDIFFRGYFWKDNHSLILRDSSSAYYLLEINDLRTVFKKLENSEQNIVQGFFPTAIKDNSKYQWGVGTFELPKGDFETKTAWSGKGVELLYRGKKVASYGPRFGLFGFQSASLNALSRSLEGAAACYAISWYGGAWNAGPTYLYYINTQTSQVREVDRNLITYGDCLMTWSPDGSRFVYLRASSSGAEIVGVIRKVPGSVRT